MDKITIQGENLSILVNDDPTVEPPIVEPPVVEPPAPDPEPPAPPVAKEGDLTVNDVKGFLKLPANPPETLMDVGLAPHPRLMVRADQKDELRAKFDLESNKVEKALLFNRNYAPNMALRGWLYDIQEDIDAAIAIFLENDAPVYDSRSHQDYLFTIAYLYTLLRPYMTDDQRTQARALGHSRLAKVEFSRGTAAYYAHPDPASIDPWDPTYIKSDRMPNKPVNYSSNVPFDEDAGNYELCLALAFAEDEPWAEYHVLQAYRDIDKFYSPYGAIAALELASLGTGGGHGYGHDGPISTGYEGMVILGVTRGLIAWHTATGENLIQETTYFEKLPEYIAKIYDGYNDLIHGTVPIALEQLTGYLSPNAAALARHYVDQKKSYYGVAYRMCCSDMDGPRMTPEAYGAPLKEVAKGAQFAFSRTSYGPDNIAVYVTGRTVDYFRNEPGNGLVSIFRGDKPLLARGCKSKSGYKNAFGSSFFMFDMSDDDYASNVQSFDDPSTPEDEPDRGPITQYDSNYWLATRAGSVNQIINASDPSVYLPNNFIAYDLDGDNFDVTVDLAKYLRISVAKATRRVIREDNIIRVYDHCEGLQPGAIAGVNWRLTDVPMLGRELVFDADQDGVYDNKSVALNGNSFETALMKITVNGAPMSVRWLYELMGPMGLYNSSHKTGATFGYSSNQQMNDHYGVGSLWFEPITQDGNHDIETVIEVK